MKKAILLSLLINGFIQFAIGQISLVKDIEPGPTSSQYEFNAPGIIYGDKYIFPALTVQNGLELWITDGTSEGTQLLKDINPGPDDSDPFNFILAFGKVYFGAVTPATGRELWVTDGTSDGTKLVSDINPGTTGSSLGSYTFYDNKVFFVATVSGDRELWTFDAQENPSLFLNLNPTAQSKPRNLRVYGDLLYFAANEHPVNASGNDEDEPFVTDGTPTGTVKLIDVTQNPAGAFIKEFVQFGDNVYFLGSEAGALAPTDQVIFRTDGTPANTSKFLDHKGSHQLMPIGDVICFYDSAHFYSVSENGDETLLADIWNKDDLIFGNEFTYVSNQVFFIGHSIDLTTGDELYTTQGTPETTILLKDIYPGEGSGDPEYLTPIGDTLLFVASSSDSDRELYISDGTPGGTERLTDLNPGNAGSHPNQLVVGQNVVYFFATTDSTGIELFKLDLKPNRVNEIENSSFVGKVYPQPNHGEAITVTWPSNNDWENASIFDITGRIVSIMNTSGMNELKIEPAQFIPGIYILRLTDNLKATAVKVLIQ